MADNCGYWKYLGESEVPSSPRILTRAEKGQALTHLEMDFNLASLFHELNTSSKGSEFKPEESQEGSDVYFERHKPTREEEMEGLFATFSYAPIVNGTESIVQNPPQIIKIQHTTDEIRYKLANEEIPGTLGVKEDFNVSGSSYVENDSIVKGNITCSGDIESKTLFVSKSAEVGDSLRVKGTASFDGNVNIEGNLYVNGILFGNLSQSGYNSRSNPNYAQQYQRYGTQGTGSHQSDKALKDSLEPISESLYKVSTLSGYSFNWNSKAEKTGHDVGLVAQEVAKVLPEAVDEGLDGYLRIDYYKIIPLLINAIKELKAEVEWLKEKSR